jgi:hypothetical protein
MRVVACIALVAVCTISIPAQPYGTDLIVAAFSGPVNGNNLLYRLSPTGRMTTILHDTLRLGSVAAVEMDNANTNLFVVHDNGWVAGVDAQNGTVHTLWAGAPLQRPADLCLSATGDLAVFAFGTSQSGVFRVPPSGGVIHTLWAPLPTPSIILPDLFTGDYLVGDGFPPTLYRLAHDGTTLTTLIRSMMMLTDIVQDPLDGSLFCHVNKGAIIRIDPGARTHWIDRSSGGWGLALDRGAGAGELVSAGTTIRRFTRTGQVVSTLPPPPSGWAARRVCFDRGRNLVTERPASPNLWRFLLHFPGEPLRPFTVGLSLTGFTPGIRAGAGRTVPIVPDDLLRLSLTGCLGPLLQGNVGLLDSAGRATVTLDLRPFPQAFHHTRVWIAAITYDLSAPCGIRTIAKPAVIVLE